MAHPVQIGDAWKQIGTWLGNKISDAEHGIVTRPVELVSAEWT
jgi:hypothetical protein